MEVSPLPDFPWRAIQRGGRFRNLCWHGTRGLKEVAQWKLGFAPWETPPDPPDGWTEAPEAVPPDRAALRQPDPARIAATWAGHSTFLLQMGGRSFLTDPHFGPSCSPVPLARFRRRSPPGLTVADLPPLDAVLLSHNHYDHLDCASLHALGAEVPIVCPAGLGRRLARWGFRHVTEMTWGETGDCGGVRLTCLPAQHGSARTPWDRDRTLWCGWLAEHAGRKAVFVGDTGYAPFFAVLGRRFGPVDVALIPIGAYRPFWFMQPLHVRPGEAVRLHLDWRAKLSLAMHWGTFALADEPMGEPPRLLRAACLTHGVDPQAFRLPRLGETISA